jgi:formate/nitrite transporter FocA (FNT family)
MKNSATMFREAGSFIAGLLIGLSIAVPVSAMLMAEPNDWQILWVFCAAIIFALGLTLQLLVTAKPGRRPTTPELMALPTDFMALSHSA